MECIYRIIEWQDIRCMECIEKFIIIGWQLMTINVAAHCIFLFSPYAIFFNLHGMFSNSFRLNGMWAKLVSVPDRLVVIFGQVGRQSAYNTCLHY